ncbi:glycosyltransferase [Thermofilum adornatum]|nr:glycosyltransferase [Thermofilum adornatum]
MSKDTKLVIVCNYTFPLAGAPWRRIEYFSNFLSRYKMDVTVIGAIELGRETSKMIKAIRGIKYDKFRVFNLQWRIGIFALIIEIFNFIGTFPLLIILPVLKPKIVYISIPYIETLPTAYLVARLIDAKIVIDVRDPLEYWPSWTKGFTRKFFGFLTLLDYILMRKSDLVLAVTPGLIRLLAQQGIVAHLVMNGADTQIFRPYPRSEVRRKLGLNDDAIVLVFSGRLGGYYDAIPLLHGIARLSNALKKKVVLLLVGGFGDASYASKFVRIAKELHLSSNIKVLQPILDARTLAEVLSAANAGVVTHVTSELYDPAIPVKFYEYLACGLPVIALSRRGSELWRLIEKWGVGFACEQHDLDCITRALEKIFDESTMESIRANVLRVRLLIDRRRAAEKLYSLLRELLEPKRDA